MTHHERPTPFTSEPDSGSTPHRRGNPRLGIRTEDVEDLPMPLTSYKWDVFVSHSSEDKEAFVRPLATELKSLGLKVWFDEFTIKPGDSLVERITNGLQNSECGIIVLSHAFIQSRWTQFEQRSLLSRHVTDDARVIPIWLNISKDEVTEYSNVLADVRAIVASSKSTKEVALEILKAVRPSMFEALRISLIAKHQRSSRHTQTVRIDQLQMSPIRHDSLPPEIIVRIRNIHYATRNLFRESLEGTIENFRRDLNPDKEVQIWERIIATFHMMIDELKLSGHEDRREALGTALMASMLDSDGLEKQIRSGQLRKEFAQTARRCWIAAGQMLT